MTKEHTAVHCRTSHALSAGNAADGQPSPLAPALIVTLTESNMARFITTCLCIASLALHANADDATTQPAKHPDASELNDRFLDPELNPEAWVDRWESESREIYAERATIVDALQLSPGMHVADVGSGTGAFIQPLAEAVTDQGRVYARDIAPKFITHIASRTNDAGLDNVDARVSQPTDPLLPSSQMNAVLLCATYHHFEHPQMMLAALHDALRPGGRLVVVDFERIPGKSREWILDHVRAGKKQVIGEIERAGFAYTGEIAIDALQENYVITFEKRAGDGESQ